MSIVTDKESGALRLPHRLDETTGMYRGKQIVPLKDVKKAEDRAKDKEKQKMEHAHSEGKKEPVHADKEINTSEKKQGLIGRMTLGKAKSRSGFGGGA